MNKLLLFIGTLFFATIGSSTSQNQLRGLNDKNLQNGQNSQNELDWNTFKSEKFKLFQERFNKIYKNDEFSRRFSIFESNLLDIINHNLDKSHTYTKGINQFTDLTPDEFESLYIGNFSNYNSSDFKLYGATNCESFSGSDKTVVPDKLDWRTKSAVSPVKDQGQCGSCWSFSASGAMEGAWAINHGKLFSLSEQELVDCAGKQYGSMGCNGGQMDGAFKYAMANGMCTEESYPYTSGLTKSAGSCSKAKCDAVATVTGCADVKPNDQKVLKEAVGTIGPISIAIEADTKIFQSYSEGVITSASCGTNLDHGVLIVGYGRDEKLDQDYWIVKNSWGTTWGEDGYVRIARSDSTSDKGICGIAMEPSYPKVVKLA
jgi:C1A family cysteine protease